MKRIKVLTIFGTRPEAIKMAPLINCLGSFPDLIDSKVCVTAQHREMLDQVLHIFKIKADYDLDIMEHKQTLSRITVKVLQGLEDVIAKVKPDIVLVHGDTTTTFAASLAAFYQQVSVGHVEAGLRTYNKYSPFPEEINRELTGVIADLHFAPTQEAAQNLTSECKGREKIFITGNTVIDAMKTTVLDDYHHPIIDSLTSEQKLIFMTAHRRENLGEPLKNICQAVIRTVVDNEDVIVVYPVHRNPVVREIVTEILGSHPRIHLIDPLEVSDTHNFMARSYLILTDSGGIQEEAPSLGVPVLVLRNTTERPEGIKAGTLRLVGTEESKIYKYAHELLNDRTVHETMSNARNPYGDGHASERIVEAILYHYGKGDRPEDFIV